MMWAWLNLLALIVVSKAYCLTFVPERPNTRCSGSCFAKTPNKSDGEWQTMNQVVSVSSPWLSLICERLRDDKGEILDYWRVEKDHSVIVMTIHRNRLVFPKKQYRPGVGQCTLDFCGGRLAPSATPKEAIQAILRRELHIGLKNDVESLEALNHEGWIVNSSFSNQLLYAFVAKLYDHVELDSDLLHSVTYSVDNVYDLLHGADQLTCLQCRSILMEWLLRKQQ